MAKETTIVKKFGVDIALVALFIYVVILVVATLREFGAV
jgi:hypothetical protein